MSDRLYRIKNRSGIRYQMAKAFLLMVCILRRLWAIARMGSYQTLVVQKESFPWGGAWVERRAKALGMRVVYDIDDGVFLAHEMAGGWRRLWWVPTRVQDIMSLADAVIVGSEPLAEFARQYSDAVHIVGTPVPDRYFEIPLRLEGEIPVRIGWIGTQTNLRYLAEIGPELREVWKSRPFELWIVGGPNVVGFTMDPVPVHAMLWSEDAEADCLASIDIGLMPLADDEWTKYKCGYKLVQYMAAGRVGVASAVGGNRTLVVDGITGILCSDSRDWVTALTGLIDDEPRRRAMASAGRQSAGRFRASLVGEQVARIVAGVERIRGGDRA